MKMNNIGTVKTKGYPYGQSTFTTIAHLDYEGKYIAPPVPPVYQAETIDVPDNVRESIAEASK